MASILRVCAATMRDIATTREGKDRTSVLAASVDAEQAAKTLESLDLACPIRPEDDEDFGAVASGNLRQSH